MLREIETRLNGALEISHLELEDDSASHTGHQGNTTGGGHFTALIVSDDFSGLSLLERHRLIYDVLDDLMGKAIHAFSMQTVTSEEFEKD